jgi:hypothetical protein
MIGDDDPVHVRMPRSVGVAPARIKVHSDPIGGIGPLCSQRHRRRDDDDLPGGDRAGRMARGQGLARTGSGHQQEVGSRFADETLQKGLLPGPQLAEEGLHHGWRPPLRRLHRGQSAWPFAGTVSPPARTGVTWSACHPAWSGAPHSAQRPCPARNSATRSADPNRRRATSVQSPKSTRASQER